ncbi:hypothetical protein ACIQU4_18060 [Streptomyces sp. NPDC090741]|uniref:hypothetical protein n=1 Tax=Streptomyces sp. NPDC090741 TaxID=3365967 RepID=UPI00380FA8A7
MDHTMDRALRLIHTYSEAGPLAFAEAEDAGRTKAMVEAIAPLPQAITRLIADALTQLRAAAQHTLQAETEFLLGRPLTS